MTTRAAAERLAGKIARLRIFENGSPGTSTARPRDVLGVVPSSASSPSSLTRRKGNRPQASPTQRLLS